MRNVDLENKIRNEILRKPDFLRFGTEFAGVLKLVEVNENPKQIFVMFDIIQKQITNAPKYDVSAKAYIIKSVFEVFGFGTYFNQGYSLIVRGPGVYKIVNNFAQLHEVEDYYTDVIMNPQKYV